MSRHTPGPWHYIGDSLTHRQFGVYAWGQSPQEHVCTVNDLPVPLLWQRDPDVAIANARLIAAAPDLLKALRQIVSQIDQGGSEGKVFARDNCIAAARAAIANATGDAA
jgi:hypothetical protein